MKKILLVISSLIILIGIGILTYSFYQDQKYKNQDTKLLENFFDNYDDSETKVEENITENVTEEPKVKNVSYLAVIEIPSISLNTGIVMSNSSFSTMNRNVSIYPTSDMPNVENGNFILFAHNGSSRVAYFKNISKLKNGNEIFIYYNNEKFTYKVINKYEVAMTDKTPLYKIKDKTIITLITCKSGNNKFRTIIVGELVK